MAADLLDRFEPEIEDLTLIPADEGRFEVLVNGKLVFSKLQSHRHAQPGEILNLIDELLKEG